MVSKGGGNVRMQAEPGWSERVKGERVQGQWERSVTPQAELGWRCNGVERSEEV